MANTQSHASANAEENVVTVVGATMIVLAVLSVIFRFYARYLMKAALWWDDWMALTAVLTAVAAGVLVLAGKSALISSISGCTHGEILANERSIGA